MSSSSSDNKDAAATPQAGSQFLTSISEIPVVSSTLTYTTAAYDKLKESHPVVNATLTTAEKSVQFASEQVKPIVQKFEKQIGLVDELACKGLGKVEEYAPAIKKTPSELLDDTKKIYNDTVRNTYTKYEDAKNYGSKKVSDLKDYGAQKTSDLIATPIGLLNNALNITEVYVDYYLPSESKTSDTNEEKDQTVKGRVINLSSKMTKGVYSNLISKYHDLQTQSQESLKKLQSTLDLIQQARDNPKQLLDSSVDIFQTRVSQLWEELNKGDVKATQEEQDKSEETAENRLLIAARRLAENLTKTYHTASILVPTASQELQDRFTTALSYSQDLYKYLNQNQSLTDLTNSLLSQVSQNLASLEHLFPKSSTTSSDEVRSESS